MCLVQRLVRLFEIRLSSRGTFALSQLQAVYQSRQRNAGNPRVTWSEYDMGYKQAVEYAQLHRLRSSSVPL